MSEALAAEWNAAMRAGDFELAWQASDRIRAGGAPDPHRFWQGEPFAGRHVMVRCLHGFGDSIQFLRYVPRLRQAAASVCIQVAPHFVQLARCLAGIGDDVITWAADAPADEPAWDVQMEVTELPYVFRTQLDDLPIAERYLHLPEHAKVVSGHSLQVGLVWTAGEWNPARSIPFEQLRPLLRVAGCTFWNLQMELSPAIVRDVERVMLQEDARCRASLCGLAQRVAALDLVITVDTLAAHLAGALGVPAWVLLQHVADWRWMEERGESPWYPSLRLFRQPAQNDWPGVIARVKEELEKAQARKAQST